MQMLAEMFRDPQAKDPDENFDAFLKDTLEQYRFRAMSTADFQRVAEQHIRPSMDWNRTGGCRGSSTNG